MVEARMPFGSSLPTSHRAGIATRRPCYLVREAARLIGDSALPLAFEAVRLEDVWRSDSPHAFSALGPEAARITADHPLDVPHGLNSPVGRVYDLDGQVLLLGIGHDANTTIHLAEVLAGVRYRRQKSMMIMQAGQLTRYGYAEIDHCCDNFKLVDQWLDAEVRQRRGRVGHGDGRLASSHDIVATVGARLRANETVFLHAPGVDDQCDEARASIG